MTVTARPSLLLLLPAAVVLACVVGQPDGTGVTESVDGRAVEDVVEVTPVRLAPAPREGALVPSELEPSRGWQLSRLRTADGPILPYRRGELGAEARTESLRTRRARRAFEGAPPTMPHSAQFVQGGLECLDCHREGMVLGRRIARPMSHVELPDCMQCHIEAAHVEFGPAAIPADNSFVGTTSPLPPAITHATALREDCRACHAAAAPERLAPGDPAFRERASPGAPPVMPHEDREEGGRDCLRCHAIGVPTTELLSHPLGLAGVEDCLACHQEDRHVAFEGSAPDPARWPREDCLACHGPFAASDRSTPPPRMPVPPPRMPHGTWLRGRCLSCHGEHGYPGLQIDHPRRTQCLQCHLPEGGSITEVPR